MWELSTGRLVLSLSAEFPRVSRLVAARDDALLVMGHADTGEVQVWDIGSGKKLAAMSHWEAGGRGPAQRQEREQARRLDYLCLSADGTTAVTLGGGLVRVHELTLNRVVLEMRLELPLACMVLSADGGTAYVVTESGAACRGDAYLCSWDLRTGKVARVACSCTYVCASLSDDEKLLALGTRSGSVCVVDVSETFGGEGGGKGGELLEVVQELQAHSAALACLAWLPDGRGLVSAPVSEAAQATAGSGGEWEWVAPVDSFKATGSTLAMWRVTE